uniref:DUF1826 domain-containing protein n=1 Tax=Odontella aurita TaxID=265563 RepID=A0A7S4HNF5_9STRA|mmetsp:Transcript_12630/g.37237  ORF Transcript_12630/g.37237 Transcript_12630/m.37237 type:complete len:272 (+) Transcript_12630:67-882(+)
MAKGCPCDDGFCDRQGDDEMGVDTEPEDSSASSSKDTNIGDPANTIEMKEIVFVDKICDLGAILSESVQLAVWRRESADTPKFAATLQDPSVIPSSLPTFEGAVTCDNVRQKLTARLCPRWMLRSKLKRALPDDEAKELIDELVDLIHIFGEISQSEAVDVKLHIVDDNGCAYWHQDCVDFRLVKTLRGPCTEWVPPEHSDATLRRYKFNSKHARSLSHRDVALFKGRGETLEDDDHLNQPGIVHRSPRVMEGSGNVRLVLVLDVPQEWHY